MADLSRISSVDKFEAHGESDKGSESLDRGAQALSEQALADMKQTVRAFNLDFKPAEDGLAKLILVDDKAQDKAQDKSSEAKGAEGEKKQSVDVLKYLADMKPENLGAGLNMARDVARELRAEADPKAAAASYEGRVSAAILQSDSDYGDSVAKNWGGLALARREMMMKMSGFSGAVAELNANIATLSPDDRRVASGMVNLLQNDKLAPGLTAELRKELGQYPDVLQNFDAAKAAEKAVKESQTAVQKAQEPLLKAAGEQAATRYVMATLKEMQGNSGEAYLLKQEAQKMFDKTRSVIVGEPVQPVKPPLRA